MVNFAEELADLRARLRSLEDRAEIESLIAAYGPAVDSGSATGVSALWTANGTYQFDGGGHLVTLSGHEGLEAMVHSDGHQEIINAGSAHFLSAPDIVIAGDTATATCYSLLVRASTDAAATAPASATAGGFYVDRLSANSWELARTEAGWRVTNRVNCLINGQQLARDLLSQPSTERA